MGTIWNPADREQLSRRLATLTDAHRPRWGKMGPGQMLRHCALALHMTTGKHPIPQRKSALSNPLIRALIIDVFPFPRGAPTAPSLRIEDDRRVGDELVAVRAAMDEVAALPESQSLPPHPAFGSLTRARWGRLMYKHLDHHLRQFGA